LVLASRAGEDWARQALFARSGRMVLGLAHRILAGREDADDLSQDVFFYAFNQLDTLKNPQAFAAWLSSIVVRTASKRLRRHRLMVRLGLKSKEALDPETMVSRGTPADVAADLRAVYRILQRLDPEERVALVLRRVEGLELAEIAEQMQLSVATIKRRLAAAEVRLAHELDSG
jgi:RNA polymerase sigma-70 factor (ECF subfamily)